MTHDDKPTQLLRGRKPIYDPHLHPNVAHFLAREGFTNVQIAQAMGVNQDTIQTWIKTHSEFSEAIKAGKIPADARVVSGLYLRAIGCFVTERKVIEYPNGERRTETTTKEIPPDPHAGLAWLYNRCPDQWRRDPSKREGENDNVITITFRRVSATMEAINTGNDATARAEPIRGSSCTTGAETVPAPTS